jgi:Pyridoxamine 5'-phosphate oxidase
MMLTWTEFERQAPEMAEAGRKLLYQFGPGLAFLATVRRDGAPRLHPICPTIVDGALYGLLLPTSPKFADLKRDGRYALHTFPPEKNDDEFLIMGRARVIDDPAQTARVRADQIARGMTSTEDEGLIRFDLERVMYAKYPGGHGTWPPAYQIWKASA